MAFAIQWTGPQGLASTRRKDPVDALKYAVEMLGKGYAEVKANELLPVACAAVDSSRLFGVKCPCEGFVDDTLAD